MEAARTIAVNPSHMPVILRVCRDPAKSLGQRWPLPPVGRAHRLSLGSPGSWRFRKVDTTSSEAISESRRQRSVAGGNTRKLALNEPKTDSLGAVFHLLRQTAQLSGDKREPSRAQALSQHDGWVFFGGLHSSARGLALECSVGDVVAHFSLASRRALKNQGEKNQGG